MSSVIAVREAVLSDLSEIHKMQCLLADHEVPFDANIDLQLKSAEKSGYIGYVNMEEKIQNKDTFVVVAVSRHGDSELIVGVCYGQIKQDEDWSIYDVFGYVGCVYIKEDFRGQGIWPEMLKFLETWFREREIKQIRLECYVDNPAAVRAYSKTDFSPVQYVMHKNL